MARDIKQVRIFTTTGSEELAVDTCQYLNPRLHMDFIPPDGILMGKTRVKRFSNGNVQVQVENVRGFFAVVIHTQVPPVDANLMELFALLDAIKNAHPADVLVVFPYMPYARSDQKNQPRISTMACFVAEVISTVFKVENVILLDPHDSHTKHYFKPSADEISAIYLMADYIEKQFFSSYPKEKCVVVFADNGSAKRFGKLAHLIKLPVAYIDKDRPDDNERPDFERVVGEVRDKICLVIDDEILTGGTSIGDANLLKKERADMVFMLAIHPGLAYEERPVEEVIARLTASPIQGIVLTDSIPVRYKVALAQKFKILSVAPLLAEAIKRTAEGSSLTDLHEYSNVILYRG